MDMGIDRNIPAFPGGTSGKEPSCQCRRCKRLGFDPGLGRSHGRGHDNPLQYSCLENPMDRGDWQATVHRVTESWTHSKQPKRPSITEQIKKMWMGGCTQWTPAR